jgi:ferrous iron transport protein A
MTLGELPVGKEAMILAVNGRGVIRDRLLDMGLTPRTRIMIRKVAPLGDPIELSVRSYALTLRKEDANNIIVEAAEA